MQHQLVMDPWVGQTLRRYRKKKGWVQEELGQYLLRAIEAKAGRKEKGLSKSTISRIEKNTFIPPQSKLEILVELLEINHPEERRRLFELCGYTPPQAPIRVESREERLERELEDQALDGLKWLELLSVLNQERRFQEALDVLSRAQMALLKLDNGTERALTEKLLYSKQQMTFALQDPNPAAALQRSWTWADEAEQIFRKEKMNLTPAQRAGFQFEIARSQASARYEFFYREQLRIPDARAFAELEKNYTLIQKKLEGAKPLFEKETIPKNETTLQQYLYLQREQASLAVKWLEIQEIMALKQYLGQKSPELKQESILTHFPLLLYAQSRQRQQKPAIIKILKDLFTVQDQKLVFQPAAHLQAEWTALSEGLTRFIETHQELTAFTPAPDSLPRVPIVNTGLLYAVALVRTGRFSRFDGQLFLNTLYLMSNPHTLPAWYYVATYAHAFAYLQTEDSEHLDQALKYWMFWCQGRLEQPERFDRQRFTYCLKEPCLWSVLLQLKLEKPARRSVWLDWFLPKFEQVLEDELKEMKQKG